MCHFVTATLAAGDDREAVAAVADRFGRKWEILENPHVTEQLPSGEQYFLTTRGHCDCGTALGSGSSRGSEPSLDREVRELKKKGWGQAKIDRWLSEKTAARSRREASRVPSDSWEQLIPAILKQTGAKRVGLLLHWYSGGVSSERIGIVRQEAIPADQVCANFLSQIEEDVVYQFVGPA